MKKEAILTFKPKQVTRQLLAVLNPRARDVMVKRYGLGQLSSGMTLESIGLHYGITRERVRQIENYALSNIRRSEAFRTHQQVFDELRDVMEQYGGLVKEKDFLAHVSAHEGAQNHVHFLLVLGDYFERLREDEDFHHRWTIDAEFAERIHGTLRKLFDGLREDELVAESDILLRFLALLKQEVKEIRDENVLRRWLALPKFIGKNPLGEWGVAHSPNVRARGIRDLAFLVLRDHGSPMHFSEVARAITEKFARSAHQATVHNELIKDKRFVLVGRGLYALREWGYERGIVREVIRNILETEGPLSKNDIIDKVLKERHVKENTILVNLQNSRHFKKDRSGRYSPV